MMSKKCLNYRCIEAFHDVFYKDLLTDEHIGNNGQLIRLSKLTDTQGDEDYNFWGNLLVKDNTSYLVSLHNDADQEVNLRDILPLKVLSHRKMAFQKEVFHEVTNYKCSKFRPKKHMELMEAVKSMAQLAHSNPPHQVLNIMQEICSYMDTFALRKVTPPGFGKDSVTQIFNSLFGKFHIVTKPSVAKVQYEASICKNLVLSEISSMAKADWDSLEPILLNCSDGKGQVQKNTRAGFGVGDTISIKNLAICMFYNDIDRYETTKKYLDFVANDAVPDRFVPFRMWGRLQENFALWGSIDPMPFAKENIGEYRAIIETIEYYKVNKHKLQNGWKRDKLGFLNMNERDRWIVHIHKLLNVIDLCCASQKEFDFWVEVINESITDYIEMLMYPKLLPGFYSRMKIPKATYEKFSETKIVDAQTYFESLLERDENGQVIDSSRNKKLMYKIDYVKSIIKANTFIEKNKLLQNYSNIGNDTVVNDKEVEW